MSAIARLANAQGEAFPKKGIIPWTGARTQTLNGIAQFLASNDMRETLQASDTINTEFDYRISSTGFGPKRPAADHRSAGGGDIVFMKTSMTEYEWASVFKWHEKYLQGNSVMSPEGSQRFWSILRKREKDWVMDPLLKLEQALFEVPNANMFEGNSTGVWELQSIHTKVNEWEPRYGVAAENLYPGMANYQSLNPEDARFRRVDAYGRQYDVGRASGELGGSQLAPTKVRYAEAGNIGAGGIPGPDHLLEQMRYLMQRLKWHAVPMAGEFGEQMMVTPKYITCSHEGERLFHLTNRSHGEFFATLNPMQDPVKNTSRMGGVALMPCDSWAMSAVFPNVKGGAGTEITAVDRPGVTEGDNEGIVGPRYAFFDGDSMDLWFHADRAWELGPWREMHPINEDVMRRLGKSIMNLHCHRPMTNGLLIPSQDIANFRGLVA